MTNIDRIKKALDKIEECERIYHPKEAAILILLIPNNDDFSIILEKRAKSLSVHSKQISFVGGSIDKEDKSPLDAALREAEEEIGIKKEDIEIIGCLSKTTTKISNFFIYPYVGLLKKVDFTINKSEVQRLIFISLNWLIKIHPFKEIKFSNERKTFTTYIIKKEKDVIWGATARILNDLIRRIKENGNQND